MKTYIINTYSKPAPRRFQRDWVNECVARLRYLTGMPLWMCRNIVRWRQTNGLEIHVRGYASGGGVSITPRGWGQTS